MNKNINTICVFASSSNTLDDKYTNIAAQLGRLIANNGYNIVYGGSNRGLMGACISAAFSNGSHITGVMPEKLRNLGIEKGNCSEFILTQGMRERKAKMDELSQAIIALPGGFGTLEEVSEMIVQKQLGYNSKPIVLLNAYGFYDKLIEFFNKMINESFASKKCCELYYFANTPKEAINYISRYNFNKTDYILEKLALK